MSLNIVDLVKGQLTSQVTEQIGSALGESNSAIGNALSGAVPTILGSLIGRSQQSGGADALHRMLGEQDDGILDNIGSLIGGGQHAGFAQKGSGLLSSLLGDSGVGGIVSAISRFSGLGRGSSGSLIGMLIPIIMSVLKRNTGGMDAGGLANLLKGQAGNISSAMPNGLGDALKSEGLLDSLGIGDALGDFGSGVANVGSEIGDRVGSAVNSVGDAVGDAAHSAGDAAANVGRAATGAATAAAGAATGAAAATAKRGGGLMSKLLPLLILAAVLLALWFIVLPMFSDKTADVGETMENAADKTTEMATGAADTVKDAASDAVDTAKDVASDAVDTAKEAVDSASETVTDAMTPDIGEFSGQLGGIFDTATSALGGITDAATAESALPQLTQVGDQLDDMTSVFDQIPEAARGPINSMVGDKLGGLQELIDKVVAIPGVGDILKPIIDTIMSKLSAFGG